MMISNAVDSTLHVRYAPLLSVVVPVYNEGRTVTALLDRLYEEKTSKEIIVVNDGSSDDSGKLVDAWISQMRGLNPHTSRIVQVEHTHNRGKGRAVRSGLDVAQGEYFLVQDADLELCPSNYPSLLAPILTKQAQVVLGSRVVHRAAFRNLHRLGITIANALIRLAYGYRVSDAACCYKLTRTDTVRTMDLQCEGFEFCPEFLAKVARLGLSVQEVAVAYAPRRPDEGKKLQLIRDGRKFLATLIRFRNWSPPATHAAGRETAAATILPAHPGDVNADQVIHSASDGKV